jgi:hypothetical protein
MRLFAGLEIPSRLRKHRRSGVGELPGCFLWIHVL